MPYKLWISLFHSLQWFQYNSKIGIFLLHQILFIYLRKHVWNKITLCGRLSRKKMFQMKNCFFLNDSLIRFFLGIMHIPPSEWDIIHTPWNVAPSSSCPNCVLTHIKTAVLRHVILKIWTVLFAKKYVKSCHSNFKVKCLQILKVVTNETTTLH